jgi:hypothetical protein
MAGQETARRSGNDIPDNEISEKCNEEEEQAWDVSHS